MGVYGWIQGASVPLTNWNPSYFKHSQLGVHPPLFCADKKTKLIRYSITE